MVHAPAMEGLLLSHWTLIQERSVPGRQNPRLRSQEVQLRGHELRAAATSKLDMYHSYGENLCAGGPLVPNVPHEGIYCGKLSTPVTSVQFSSVAQSCLTLRPHESQHARPPCPSPTPEVHSDSRPSSPWCHPAISSSVVPFSSCPQPLPASESFPVSQLFAWGGQSTCYIRHNKSFIISARENLQ